MRKALFILIASAFALCLIFLPAHAAGKSVWKKEILHPLNAKIYSAVYETGKYPNSCTVWVLKNKAGLKIYANGMHQKIDRHQRIEIKKDERGFVRKMVTLNLIKNCGEKG